MTDKEPTPIRKPLVPVPADEPQPLTFPKPTLTDEQLRNLVASYVAQALDERDERVARALYKVVMDWPIAEIMVMGEEQFIALFLSAKGQV
jgi:hypothetical protein